MNPDEFLKIIGPSNFPIASGGHNSENFDMDCEIYNLVIFDGKYASDEIIKHGSKFLEYHMPIFLKLILNA